MFNQNRTSTKSRCLLVLRPYIELDLDSCADNKAMAIALLFEDSPSNRHDGVYLAYYFLGTSLHYITGGKL